MPKPKLAPIEGKVEFARDSTFKRAWIAITPTAIYAAVHAQQDNTFAIEVQATAWSPPNYPAIVFNKLDLNGILQVRSLT